MENTFKKTQEFTNTHTKMKNNNKEKPENRKNFFATKRQRSISASKYRKI